MANPLFNAFGGNPQMNNIIRQFQQFKSTFQGNPQEQVQSLLNSGRITQEQYNQAVQMANALRNVLK